MFGPPSKTFVLVFYQTVKTFRRSYCEMEMKQNTVWKKKGFGVCMLMCFYNHVAKCDQFEVKLVWRVWAGFEMQCVCVYFHHVSWHMFPLLLAANGEFPPRSLSTHRPCTRHHVSQRALWNLRKRLFFFLFSFFAVLWECALVWLNEVPSAVSLFET